MSTNVCVTRWQQCLYPIDSSIAYARLAVNAYKVEIITYEHKVANERHERREKAYRVKHF